MFPESSCVMGCAEREIALPDSSVPSWCLNKVGIPYLSLKLYSTVMGWGGFLLQTF